MGCSLGNMPLNRYCNAPGRAWFPFLGKQRDPQMYGALTAGAFLNAGRGSRGDLVWVAWA